MKPLRFAGLDLGNQPTRVATALERLIPAGAARNAIARSACRSPECVVDAAFGPETGEILLLLYTDYGLNGSHLGRSGSRAWTGRELATILAAARDIPFGDAGAERPLVRDDNLDRYRSQLAIIDPAQSLIAINGEGRVGLRFGALWAAMPAMQRRAAALHELAHELSRTRGKKEGWDAAWLEAMAADRYLSARGGLQTSHVSRYAMTNPAEDFAESVVAYRYAPELMKYRAPNRLRFLRERVFKEAGEPVASAARDGAKGRVADPRQGPSSGANDGVAG